MGYRVWQVSQEQFVETWNGAGSLPEDLAKVKELAGGALAKRAVMWRATAPRKGGEEMKSRSAMTPAGSCNNPSQIETASKQGRPRWVVQHPHYSHTPL